MILHDENHFTLRFADGWVRIWTSCPVLCEGGGSSVMVWGAFIAREISQLWHIMKFILQPTWTPYRKLMLTWWNGHLDLLTLIPSKTSGINWEDDYIGQDLMNQWCRLLVNAFTTVLQSMWRCCCLASSKQNNDCELNIWHFITASLWKSIYLIWNGVVL